MDTNLQKMADRALEKLEVAALGRDPKEIQAAKTQVVDKLPSSSTAKMQHEQKLLDRGGIKDFIVHELQPVLAGGIIGAGLLGCAFFSPLMVLGAGVGLAAGLGVKGLGLAAGIGLKALNQKGTGVAIINRTQHADRMGVFAGITIASFLSTALILLGLKMIQKSKRDGVDSKATGMKVDEAFKKEEKKVDFVRLTGVDEGDDITYTIVPKKVDQKPDHVFNATVKKQEDLENPDIPSVDDFIKSTLEKNIYSYWVPDEQYQEIDVGDREFGKDDIITRVPNNYLREDISVSKADKKKVLDEKYLDKFPNHKVIKSAKGVEDAKNKMLEAENNLLKELEEMTPLKTKGSKFQKAVRVIKKKTGQPDPQRKAMRNLERLTLEVFGSDDKLKNEALENPYYQGVITEKDAVRLLRGKPDKSVMMHYDPEQKGMLLSFKYEKADITHIKIGLKDFEEAKKIFESKGWKLIEQQEKEGPQFKEQIAILQEQKLYHGVISHQEAKTVLSDEKDGSILVHYDPEIKDIVLCCKLDNRGLNESFLKIPMNQRPIEDFKGMAILKGFSFVLREANENLVESAAQEDLSPLKLDPLRDNMRILKDTDLYHGEMSNSEAASILAGRSNNEILVHYNPKMKGIVLSCKLSNGSISHIPLRQNKFEDFREKEFFKNSTFIQKNQLIEDTIMEDYENTKNQIMAEESKSEINDLLKENESFEDEMLKELAQMEKSSTETRISDLDDFEESLKRLEAERKVLEKKISSGIKAKKIDL